MKAKKNRVPFLRQETSSNQEAMISWVLNLEILGISFAMFNFEDFLIFVYLLKGKVTGQGDKN